MDKTAFENMDLSEFISSLTESMTIECNKAIIKRLLYDIIEIYNGRFTWYGVYKNTMENENRTIDFSYSYNKFDFKINCVYVPKHIILEEFAFNYIRDLSKRGPSNENS